MSRSASEEEILDRQWQKQKTSDVLCKVTDIDEDELHPGHRLFQVTYNDGDEEWADAGDIHAILLPLASAQVIII